MAPSAAYTAIEQATDFEVKFNYSML